MFFRGYRRGDLEAMFVLDERCFESPFRVSFRDLGESADAPDAFVLLAEEDGVLAGFVIANFGTDDGRHAGYIVTLDVRMESRCRGLGATLMHRAEEAARERGCAAILLHVFVGNAAATRLYARLGYERVGVVANFYARGVDAWMYRRGLEGIPDTFDLPQPG